MAEVFIIPDEHDPIARTREAVEVGQTVDWRISAIAVELVNDLQRHIEPDEMSQYGSP